MVNTITCIPWCFVIYGWFADFSGMLDLSGIVMIMYDTCVSKLFICAIY